MKTPFLKDTRLRETEPGMWRSDGPRTVAYPSAGHAWCREIEERSFWFRHRSRCIVSALDAYPPSGWILDIGGGNGFVSASLRAAGRDAIVLEPGEEGARTALERGLAPVICSTLEAAGFHAASIPAGGLFDVLEHLPDEQTVLRQLSSLLVPGGRLYVTVPAYRWLWSLDDDYAQHRDRYTASRLATSLIEAGFRVEFCSYFFSALPPAILLLRSLPSRLGLKRPINPITEAREHGARFSWPARLIERLLSPEAGRIRRRRGMPWGASCLAVARRPGATQG